MICWDGQLCRKDNLIKNVKRMRKQLEREGKYGLAVRATLFPSTLVV